MERPVGKKVASVNPMEGVISALSFMRDAALGKDIGRSMAITNEIGDITIDTCCPTDTGIWETGVLRESVEGKWVIVSQYKSAEEAAREHKKWVELVKEEPACELKDIDTWGIGR